MTRSSGTARLRRVLLIDALASGASGLLVLAGAQVFANFGGVPSGLVLPLGVFLLAYAAALWFIETRPNLNTSAVQAVIIANGLWIVLSVLVVVFGWLPLTGLGTAIVLAQAAAVALLADLEFLSLRQSTHRAEAQA